MNALAAEQSADLSVEESTFLPPEAVALINRTSWGSEGARYRVHGFSESLANVPGSRFLLLWKRSHLVAMRMLVQKTVSCGPKQLPAVYHSLFIVNPEERGSGYGKALAAATVKAATRMLAGRGLVYAYTEQGNIHSARIKAKQGYEPLGRFQTVAISRFFPRASRRVSFLEHSERSTIVSRLSRQYIDHALSDFQSSVMVDHYYVVRHGADILAGVQVKPQHWTIESLDGLGGTLALKLLPKLPLMRRIFDPSHFEFLRIGNIYFQNGHAAAAYELIESVLASHRLNTAIGFFDSSSPVYQTFCKAGRFGLLNAFTETAVAVDGYLIGLFPSEKSALRSYPLAISPLDL